MIEHKNGDEIDTGHHQSQSLNSSMNIKNKIKTKIEDDNKTQEYSPE